MSLHRGEYSGTSKRVSTCLVKGCSELVCAFTYLHGRLLEGGRLFHDLFSAWVTIRDWATKRDWPLIRISTVYE